MFYVFDLKKLRIPLAAALLFFALTAIIINSYASKSESIEVVRLSAEKMPTLIIDAGHGGADGGAVSADGLLESSINLSVALKTEALAHLFGLAPVMTRTSEELDYPEEATTIAKMKLWDQKNRVAQINSVENAVLISIHQNTYPDSRPCGSQVLYAQTEGSQALGELTHSNLIQQLCPENRRVAAPISKDIYLMRSINCTGILVECGFLSNSTEAAQLADDGYQTKLAAALFASFIQYIESLQCEPVDTAG